MKKSLWKNNLKEISKTRRRFLSILVMAFLGVGFFSGLTATGPDMQESLDAYADSSKLFDIEVISTLGLTDDDVQALRNVDGVKNAYGVQSQDTLVDIEEAENVAKIIEYNENVNIPYIVEGRLPENSNECIIDKSYNYFENTEYIGKKVVINNNDTNTNGDQVFTQKELTIVGVCTTPIYISSDRGTSSVGNGSVSLFLYTKDDVLNLDYYTNIYVSVKDADKVITNSEEYLNIVNPVLNNIETIKEEREQARHDQLVNDATEKLNDSQKEFDEEKAKVESELSDAEKLLNDGKEELDKSEQKIKDAEKQLKSKENSAKKEFDDADEKIKNAEEELNNNKKSLETAKSDYGTQKGEAEVGLVQLNSSISEYESQLETLKQQRKQLLDAGQDTTSVDTSITMVEAVLTGLYNSKNDIESKLDTAKKEIDNAEGQIKAGEDELKTQKDNLDSAKKTANSEISKAKKEIEKGKKQLEDGKTELNQKTQEFEDSKAEAQSKLDDAQKELDDAREEIRKIENAKWYIQDRLDNSGYSNMIDAVGAISNLSKMFPIIFYVIAILISLTSMTRMIEEERVEIGTMKAIGYTNLQIISKYILYSFLACVIGGVLGMTAGFYIIPNIIWNVYSLLYSLPKFYSAYRFNIGIIGQIIAFICIGGATIVVAVKELRNMPAVLMRPKSPKIGKKILLEKIPFIWNKLNFSQKVTFRNIFRYKKRAIMTIAGIAGCTGLMLTGFGIKNSVSDIPESQFGRIFKYEESIILADSSAEKEVKEKLDNNEFIEDYSEVSATVGHLSNDKGKYDITLFVPDSNESFDKVCSLNNIYDDFKKIDLDNEGIVITDKVSKLLDIKEGDTVKLIDSEDVEYEFTVKAITENYVSHYVYMSKELYESKIKPYSTNMILANSKEMTQEQRNELSEELLNVENVAEVTMISDRIETVDNMLDSLNYVVLILIVASALLDFVVLYNLANINIGEREREIATLKVLGFYDKEVDNYINKENMIFTVVGIALGILFGYFLTNVIITTVEIESLRFVRKILPISYIISIILTALFSIVVNYIIHFILKKIDMIESLKSVE